jgi:hypothetical protein
MFVRCAVNKQIREFCAALRACVDRLSADTLQMYKVKQLHCLIACQC